MTPGNDCNSIPPVSMLEAGLRDRIRKRGVGLNPNSLCRSQRSQRRYTLSYGASASFLFMNSASLSPKLGSKPENLNQYSVLFLKLQTLRI